MSHRAYFAACQAASSRHSWKSASLRFGRYSRHAASNAARAASKLCRGAMPIVARIAAGVEAADPLPLIGRGRGTRAFDDHANAHAGIVDVPGHGPIVNALLGQGGHLGKNAPGWLASASR